MSSPDRQFEILLVEDDPGSVRLAREAFIEANVRNRLTVARDGGLAMRFLKGEDEFVGAPRPDLVLLDLNLPDKNGQEVLKELKTDDKLRRIPVVVFTTSQSADDIVNAYGLSANCYISKPVDLDGFIRVIQAIENFWLRIVTLPSN